MSYFEFEEYKNGRVGKIKTSHGSIYTPEFIFCATKGAIKGLLAHMLDAPILLCNAFHLKNKAETIFQAGGLHKYMNWNKPIIMDSGGFQIFSMGYGSVANEIKGVRNTQKSYTQITEEGCVFKDPHSGKQELLTAEWSIETQYKLGTNLSIAFDECTASHSGYEYTKESMHRSHKWELRSIQKFAELNALDKRNDILYGIIQGGTYKDLRDESIKFINENKSFGGIAIGGSLGKSKKEMYEIVKYVASRIDKNRPRHLLGIGRIEDIIELAPYVDTFDCVEPTRIARHGIALLQNKKRLNLKNACFVEDYLPIDKNCECLVCKSYTRSYISYLIRCEEIAGMQALIIHNMYVMNNLMEKIRYHIQNNTYDDFKNQYFQELIV